MNVAGCVMGRRGGVGERGHKSMAGEVVFFTD